MDWTLAIDINRKALLRIVAGLFVQMGLVPGDGFVQIVTRRVHGMIVHVLRPAEAAVRRLIVVQARGMKAPPPVARQSRKAGKRATPKGSGDSVPAFPLFDPRINPEPRRKTVPGYGPRIRYLDEPNESVPGRSVPMPDDPVSAIRLCQRLLAIKAALDDLPKQAQRLVRALARPSCKWKRVMRYARPPGYRARGKEEIDEILLNCQAFALWVTEAPDTS